MTIQEFKKSKEDKAKSVLSGEKNINGLRVKFVDINFYKAATGDHRVGKQSSSNVVHASDRVFVLAEFNGIRIPFYISTGDGGKEKVPVGKWYPIFGHMGWVNKGSQEEINDAYGSKALKDIKNWLDQNVGFLGEADDNGYFSLSKETQVNESAAKPFYDSLNRDLKPTAQKNQFDTPEEYQKKEKNIQLGKQHMIDLVAKATSENNVENTSATISPSVGQLMKYIVSQCKGDAYEIFLWSEGKSIVNNPPIEIRNIIVGMNPKTTGSNYVIDNVDAVNYFKAWVPMKTLGDEAFEYILENNEEYLNLYKNFGKPTQIQNVDIYAKEENRGNDSEIDRLRLKAKEEMNKPSMLKQSSMAIRKIRF